MSSAPLAPPPPSTYPFRAGATVLKPCHITRYKYPCLLGHAPSILILETSLHASQRRRPQGQAHFDPTFTTITRAPEVPLFKAKFRDKFGDGDEACANPLGRAMKRVSRYPRNTLLEVGKFRFRNEDGREERVVFVTKRTTVLALGKQDKGAFGNDERVYEIPAESWREMMVEGRPGHDSWWMRINVGW
jgi:hypothetical protein